MSNGNGRRGTNRGNNGLGNNGRGNNRGNNGNAVDDMLPNSPSSRPTRRLPLSGSEDTYTDLIYGTARGKGNNNCYGYAIDHYRNSGNHKLQPGNVSKSPGDLNLGSCAALRLRTLADLKGRAYAVDGDKPCRAGHYKIMAFLSKDNDYHWYKQHKDALVRLSKKMRDLAALSRALHVNPKQLQSPSSSPKPGDLVLVRNAGLWSHKQGLATGPLLRDACGKVITDPRKACKDYGRLNYTDYCGSFCVQKRGE